jgi:signal transduction histidine kinase
VSAATSYIPRVRVERWISVARVVLATLSLVALVVDPLENDRQSELARRVLVAYVLYAAVIALLVARTRAWSHHGRLTVHAADLATSAALMTLTTGPSSVFFVFFVFDLFAAMLRWSWRGTLWTAAIVTVAYAVIGVETAASNELFELNRFIVRVGYLGVVAMFLTYIGWFEDRRRAEIERVASWPPTTGRNLEAALGPALAHGAGIVGTTRLVLLWERGDEPWIDVLSWTNEGVEVAREPPSGRDLAGLVAAHRSPDDLVVPLSGTDGIGMLIVGGGARADVEVALVEIVGHQLVAGLERHLIEQRLRTAAVTQERLRVARNLHDGVVQALTAARLQLQAAAQDGTLGDADRTRARLHAIEGALAIEQRELRSLIDQMRPFPRAETPLPDLAGRLASVRDRASAQWGLVVTIDGPIPTVPPAFLDDATFLVQEALINAARHGKASTARVTLGLDARSMHIVVADDGTGFPFTGRLTLPQLRERGPTSIAERVAALHGTLEVESAPGGARLEITIPLEEAT